MRSSVSTSMYLTLPILLYVCSRKPHDSRVVRTTPVHTPASTNPCIVTTGGIISFNNHHRVWVAPDGLARTAARGNERIAQSRHFLIRTRAVYLWDVFLVVLAHRRRPKKKRDFTVTSARSRNVSQDGTNWYYGNQSTED